MNRPALNALVIAGVLVVVGGVALLRSNRSGPERTEAPGSLPGPSPEAASATETQPGSVPASEGAPAPNTEDVEASEFTATPPAVKPVAAKLPRVVDLGADQCKACKDLAPILEELRKEYEGRVTVEFIDVWKNEWAGKPYGIRVIPTQIFFDTDGKEIWRHEGSLAKEEFVKKFAEMGVK
ncbi:MAG: thioredoxin domain-containing protein [Planctomycetota bacterium]